mgnify:CR=1 FL=1
MSEPLKPRIDFDGPLQAEKIPPLKGARAFDTLEADNFAPARLVTGEEEEGAAEAVVESVLRPKRSLWRRMVSAGLAIFGVSVVAQGVQWTANAWQTQDWIALGGCVAGALIVGAGVGSVATEWRRLWRLRQRAHERDEARDMLHSHAVGKAKAFCEKLAQQAGLDYTIGTVVLRGAHPNTALLRLEGVSGRKLEVMGASIGGGRINICQIDGITTNFGGDHNTLIVHNQDTPGHVAEVTTALAQRGINIATMQLYRSTAGGYAVMVLECDQPLPDALIAELRGMQGIVKVTGLNLAQQTETKEGA